MHASLLTEALCHRHTHYIGGTWRIASGPLLDLIDPYTESPFGSAPLGKQAEVDEAVAAARDAQAGWAALAPEARAHWLSRWHEALMPRAEAIAQLISHEMGAPLAFARQAQAGGGLAALQAFARMAGHMRHTERIGSSVVVREPGGVAGLISAWNYPFFLAVGKVAPALLAGCPVVLKPSDLTPLSAFVMADAAHEIGLPAGVFNLVHGTGAAVGEAITGHPDIDIVSYTGSIPVGRRVMERAAATIKRISLELGGKSAAIVLPGADLAGAVCKTVTDCFANAGQTCIAITRLLVPRGRMQEAAAIAADAAATYRLGDPRAPSTTMGPLANSQQRERVRRYIAMGLEDGAELVVGGADAPAGQAHGYFVQPTIFANVRPDARIAQEEIFGPVLSLIAYDDVDHAVAIANGTVHGLNGGVYAASEDEALPVAARLRCGKVDINGGGFNLNAPAGGYKQSGIGRERGHYALHEYLEIKSIQYPTDDAAARAMDALTRVEPA